MKRRFSLGLVISFISVLVLLLPGCSASPAAAAQTASNNSATAGATLSAERLAYASATYDEVITLSGQDTPIQVKVWMNSNKARFEVNSNGANMVTLVDRDDQVQYSYNSSQKTAARVDLKTQAEVPMETALTTTSAWEWAQLVNNDPDSTAPEHCQTLDGLHCFVIHTPYQGDTLRTLMASDYALPLRIEFLGNVLEFKNFNFTSQPDNLFQLPSGFTVKK
jgi:hypothetical protein